LARNRIVIIGGVATGPKAAARCRRLDQEAEITIVERGDLLSYAGCGMPFYIEGIVEFETLLKTSVGVTRDTEYFEKGMGIRIMHKTEAVSINRDSKTVTVKNLETGETADLLYDKLVLATGASPFVPRMEGVELEGVHRLYNPHQAKAIRDSLDRGAKRVAIVGGGLIGMETCGAFLERGCEVTILEMMPHLVPALMDEEMALLLESYLKENGVQVVTGSAVSRMLDDGSGRIAGVETANGRRFDADLVIVAIGVRPNTELAVKAGLEIGPTRAIAVNERLQTSDPDIYAGGDCVECIHLVTGGKVYTPMGSTANKHGRIIANNINGKENDFPGVTATAVFKILGYNCGCTGITEKRARELGYEVETSLCPQRDYSFFMPGASMFVAKLVTEKTSGRILGCQVVGTGDGVKRIDVVATALRYGGSVKDLADMDLAYAPPFNQAIDAIAHAANVVRNKMDGLAHGVSPVQMKRKLESDDDFLFVDCRGRADFEAETITDHRTVNISMEELLEKLDGETRDKEIILFCNTSITAYRAERILKARGFNDVKFLDGSLKAWPYPLKAPF
jgi:NADPH-dependent 2,4-dienoyl-CoA reductase/sulfur reductase-like enzyme/rhodanese-related sulfurtransferase